MAKEDFAARKLKLQENLQAAMKVEHFTIPPYLCALYSIEEGTNVAAAAVIQSVVMEEMLHMVLVANMLNAIGGKPVVNTRDYLPKYPNPLPLPYKDHEKPFIVRLGKLSHEAVATFMDIERPKRNGDTQMSIGKFYDELREEFTKLYREDATQLFTGKPEDQVTSEHYYGGAGRLWPIIAKGKCLKDSIEVVKRAIEEIIDQGEGHDESIYDANKRVRPAGTPLAILRSHRDPARETVAGGSTEAYRQTTFSGDEEPAHYYRFKEIHVGRYYGPDDKPCPCESNDKCKCGPTGPELPIRWNAVYDMIPDPEADHYPEGTPIREKLDAFDRCYKRLLDRLQEGFNGNPNVFVGAVGEMHEMKYRAVELMRIPTGKGDTMVGPRFEWIDG